LELDFLNRRRFLNYCAGTITPLILPSILPLYKSNEIIYPKIPIVDVHVHLLGSSPLNGCYVSKRFQKSFAVRMSRFFIDFGKGKTPQEEDEKYVDRLLRLVSELPDSWRGILLPMDGVYDSSGALDYNKTLFFISNDYSLTVATKSGKLISASSINPYRKDAIFELERVSSLGAVLVKWIPNTMGINPSDNKLITFYKKMKDLNMTLLTHTGTEHAVGGAIDQTFGNPKHLILPLEEGVNVVAAHCASGGGDSNGSYFSQFLDMLNIFPNLYGDISGLSLLHKTSSLKHLIKNPHYFEKLCYGSDFPLYFTPATSPFYFLGLISFGKAMKLGRIENDLSRDISTLVTLSVPNNFFGRGYKAIPKIQ
tara:strand:+ start:32625 stop:33725 length:1101 start_codon:yes stop_codon:yes gene_type:complete